MIEVLKERFKNNMHLHPDLSWEQIEKRLLGNEEVLEILRRMEESGGEPDTIGFDEGGRLIFCDCSKETPLGRRSLCYDDEALRKRKNNPPKGSALSQALEMGVNVMDEQLYLRLQELGDFDLKSHRRGLAQPAVHIGRHPAHILRRIGGY